MSFKNSALLLSVLLLSMSAQAMFVELGVNYSYKKTTFSELDYIEQQGTTGSVSFYFWERIALELSYTNGLYVKQEKESASTSSTTVRVTTQWSEIYGADLIYVFADRKAVFQPYVKGGAAYIKKRQRTQIDTQQPIEPADVSGMAPSYGAGFKVLMTENTAIRVGADVIKTPIDNDNTANDINGRVGVTWIF
jgi:outer membrane protein W